MTEIDPGGASDVSPDRTADPITVRRQARTSLRRSVRCLAVIALLFAGACAVGVFFGIRYYDYAAGQPATSRARAQGVWLAKLWIANRATLAVALLMLARALWAYARALGRADDQDDDGDGDGDGDDRSARRGGADAASLTASEVRCWQAVIRFALLYAGWELTAAFFVPR